MTELEASELFNKVVVGVAGAGLVKVHYSLAIGFIKSEIDTELLRPENKSMLEEYVVLATNNAISELSYDLMGLKQEKAPVKQDVASVDWKKFN